MVNPDNYFDLYDFFVNELIGSQTLAIIVSFLLLYWFTSKFNINFQTTVLLSLVLLVGLALMFSNQLLWLLAGIIAGALFFYMISTLIRRG